MNCARCDRKSDAHLAVCARCKDVLFGVTEDVPWTEFEEAYVNRSDPNVAYAFQAERLYKNSRYQVAVRAAMTPSGRMIHLSIKRLDKQPIRDRRELQRIKNDMFGPEVEAVEVFPRESQMVDTSNQYHLWCFPDAAFPFAFDQGRLVTEVPVEGSVQRPWPVCEKPADLKSKDEMIGRTKEAVDEYMRRMAQKG